MAYIYVELCHFLQEVCIYENAMSIMILCI